MMISISFMNINGTHINQIFVFLSMNKQSTVDFGEVKTSVPLDEPLGIGPPKFFNGLNAPGWMDRWMDGSMHA